MHQSVTLCIFVITTATIAVSRDGQGHHLLVILKIRLPKHCDLKDQDQDRDLKDQAHFTFSTQREVVVMMG